MNPVEAVAIASNNSQVNASFRDNIDLKFDVYDHLIITDMLIDNNKQLRYYGKLKQGPPARPRLIDPAKIQIYLSDIGQAKDVQLRLASTFLHNPRVRQSPLMRTIEEFALSYESPLSWPYVAISINQLFAFQKWLGQGGFGTVWLGKVKSNALKLNVQQGQLVAIKQLRSDVNPKEIAYTDDEIRILSRLKAGLEISKQCHPGLACLYGFFTAIDNTTQKPARFIVSEYVQGQVLTEVIQLYRKKKNLKLSQITTMLLSALRALAYIHSYQIAHRDIKPDNIMVQIKTSQSVLLDFGLACFEELNCNASGGGTVFFYPPERFTKGSEQLPLTEFMAGDVYALGICFAMFFNSKINSGTINDARTFFGKLANYTNEYGVLDLSGFQPLDNIIRSMVDLDWRKRPTAESAALQVVQLQK